MLRSKLPRATFANVMSCLALFIALGGTGIAAVAGVAPGSVGNAQLKPNSVGTGKVIDGSLRAVDFKSGELPAGARGATGPTGAAGAAGPAGPAGSIKSTITVVGSGPQLGPNGGFGSGNAICPSGYQAIGGGVDLDSGSDEKIATTEPVVDNQNIIGLSDGQHNPATGWRAFVLNQSTTTVRSFKVMAVCSPIG